jgi:hypothetical protein
VKYFEVSVDEQGKRIFNGLDSVEAAIIETAFKAEGIAPQPQSIPD